MQNARDIILRPIISEKTMGLLAENKYTFEVDPQANKSQIKKAVEEIFDVKVIDVSTINMKGKPKRYGIFRGYRPKWKKAIVTLRAGDRIEFFEDLM